MSSILWLIAGSYTLNSISDSSVVVLEETLIDDVILSPGAEYTTPVNIDEPAWNLRTYFTYGIPLPKYKINVNANTSVSYSKEPGYINGEFNNTDLVRLSQGFVMSSNVTPNLDFTLNASTNYNIVKYAILPETDNNYFNHRIRFKINVILPNDFFVSSQLSYTNYSSVRQGYNSKYAVLNASLGRYIFRNRKGEIKLSVFDALNEEDNIGIEETQSYIEYNKNSTIGRFYLLTFVYNFRKFNGGDFGRM